MALLLPIDDPARLLAPLVAVLAGVGLYYYAGARWLGPDDDWWSPVRHAVFPAIGRLLGRAFGGYATGVQQLNRYAGTAHASPDAIERILARAGADRGPLAAAKAHPDGRETVSSWHHREVRQPTLRRLLDVLEQLPLAGRVLRTLESLLALRQDHVRLYATEHGNTDVFADEEWNALNPLTAYWHYRGKAATILGTTYPAHRPSMGRAWVKAVLSEAGIKRHAPDASG